MCTESVALFERRLDTTSVEVARQLEKRKKDALLKSWQYVELRLRFMTIVLYAST